MAYFRSNVSGGIPAGVRTLPTVDTASGSIATFNTDLTENLVSVKCQIVAKQASGTPSPVNPLPITTYTEMNLTRCGVNLFDKSEIMNGYIVDSTGAYNPSDTRKCTDFIAIKGGETYKILSEQEDSAWGAWYDINKNYISGCAGYYVGGTTLKTAPANAHYVRLTVMSNSSGNIDTFGLNYPPTDTTYHTYTGDTATIPFGQTVANGVLDITTGKLRVTEDIVNIGDLTWTEQSIANHTFTAIIAGKKNATSSSVPDNIKCEIYETLSGNSVVGGTNNSIGGSTANSRIFVCDTRFSSASDFKTACASYKIIYELATPIEIQCDSITLQALLNENNIWCDTGDTEVKFLLSVGKKIS